VELKPPIAVDFDSGLLIVTLNRGDEGNPLNPELLSSLEETLSRGFADPETRVVLLRSNTDTFCVGMDLSALMNSKAQGSERKNTLKEAVQGYSRVLNSIYEGPKPVICLVTGDVRAGGVGLVCACDVVCATPEAAFNLSEVLFGLVPANVLPYLLGLRVTPAKARYLALTTRQITGVEALALGIVDELAERGKIETTLKKRVRQLMRSSPAALASVKRLTGDMAWKDLEYSRDLAVETLAEIASDPAVLEAVGAFRDGMTPPWFSRFKPSQPLFLEESE
jgi:enoyl-CoA hydratase/carnithine racemase